MQNRTRNTNLVIRLHPEERAKLSALEEADDEERCASRLIRLWISDHYRARFGDTTPKTKRRAS